MEGIWVTEFTCICTHQHNNPMNRSGRERESEREREREREREGEREGETPPLLHRGYYTHRNTNRQTHTDTQTYTGTIKAQSRPSAPAAGRALIGACLYVSDHTAERPPPPGRSLTPSAPPGPRGPRPRAPRAPDT